jgi:hypothetical protein
VLHGRIIGVVAAAVIGAALVAGCGSGSDASSEVTKAQFTKEAEAICAERKKDWDAEAAAFTKEAEAEGEISFQESRERTDEFLSTTIIPILEDELTALEELDVPEGDEAKVEKMLKSRSRGIQELKDKGQDALFSEPLKNFEKEAKAYGLNCSLA